ncbi:MAG: fumarylacetoacetate hydrolase family protein [Microbacteriaceae bacterium]
MRFASCAVGDRRFAAAIIDDRAVPLDSISELGRDTPSVLLSDPTLLWNEAVPLTEVVLRPVVPHPSKILCVGLNYFSHIGETGRDVPDYPVLFPKFSESLIGPSDVIVLPPESHQVDYEAELAIVIGTPGRRIARESALAHVAGYTVANDVTMRDYQYKTHQWVQGKAWEASTPLGPWLVTPDEVGDVSALDIRLTLNGVELQSASIGQMIFDTATLISMISEFTTLQVGDVILAGTPGGVGFRRDPQVFLSAGDTVIVEIPGIGTLSNRVVAEQFAAV